MANQRNSQHDASSAAVRQNGRASTPVYHMTASANESARIINGSLNYGVANAPNYTFIMDATPELLGLEDTARTREYCSHIQIASRLSCDFTGKFSPDGMQLMVKGNVEEFNKEFEDIHGKRFFNNNEVNGLQDMSVKEIDYNATFKVGNLTFNRFINPPNTIHPRQMIVGSTFDRDPQEKVGVVINMTNSALDVNVGPHNGAKDYIVNSFAGGPVQMDKQVSEVLAFYTRENINGLNQYLHTQNPNATLLDNKVVGGHISAYEAATIQASSAKYYLEDSSLLQGNGNKSVTPEGYLTTQRTPTQIAFDRMQDEKLAAFTEIRDGMLSNMINYRAPDPTNPVEVKQAVMDITARVLESDAYKEKCAAAEARFELVLNAAQQTELQQARDSLEHLPSAPMKDATDFVLEQRELGLQSSAKYIEAVTQFRDLQITPTSEHANRTSNEARAEMFKEMGFSDFDRISSMSREDLIVRFHNMEKVLIINTPIGEEASQDPDKAIRADNIRQAMGLLSTMIENHPDNIRIDTKNVYPDGSIDKLPVRQDTMDNLMALNEMYKDNKSALFRNISPEMLASREGCEQLLGELQRHTDTFHFKSNGVEVTYAEVINSANFFDKDGTKLPEIEPGQMTPEKWDELTRNVKSSYPELADDVIQNAIRNELAMRIVQNHIHSQDYQISDELRNGFTMRDNETQIIKFMHEHQAEVLDVYRAPGLIEESKAINQAAAELDIEIGVQKQELRKLEREIEELKAAADEKFAKAYEIHQETMQLRADMASISSQLKELQEMEDLTPQQQAMLETLTQQEAFLSTRIPELDAERDSLYYSGVADNEKANELDSQAQALAQQIRENETESQKMHEEAQFKLSEEARLAEVQKYVAANCNLSETEMENIRTNSDFFRSELFKSAIHVSSHEGYSYTSLSEVCGISGVEDLQDPAKAKLAHERLETEIQKLESMVRQNDGSYDFANDGRLSVMKEALRIVDEHITDNKVHQAQEQFVTHEYREASDVVLSKETTEKIVQNDTFSEELRAEPSSAKLLVQEYIHNDKLGEHEREVLREAMTPSVLYKSDDGSENQLNAILAKDQALVELYRVAHESGDTSFKSVVDKLPEETRTIIMGDEKFAAACAKLDLSQEYKSDLQMLSSPEFRDNPIAIRGLIESHLDSSHPAHELLSSDLSRYMETRDTAISSEVFRSNMIDAYVHNPGADFRTFQEFQETQAIIHRAAAVENIVHVTHGKDGITYEWDDVATKAPQLSIVPKEELMTAREEYVRAAEPQIALARDNMSAAVTALNHYAHELPGQETDIRTLIGSQNETNSVIARMDEFRHDATNAVAQEHYEIRGTIHRIEAVQSEIDRLEAERAAFESNAFEKASFWERVTNLRDGHLQNNAPEIERVDAELTQQRQIMTDLIEAHGGPNTYMHTSQELSRAVESLNFSNNPETAFEKLDARLDAVRGVWSEADVSAMQNAFKDIIASHTVEAQRGETTVMIIEDPTAMKDDIRRAIDSFAAHHLDDDVKNTIELLRVQDRELTVVNDRIAEISGTITEKLEPLSLSEESKLIVSNLLEGNGTQPISAADIAKVQSEIEASGGLNGATLGMEFRNLATEHMELSQYAATTRIQIAAEDLAKVQTEFSLTPEEGAGITHRLTTESIQLTGQDATLDDRRALVSAAHQSISELEQKIIRMEEQLSSDNSGAANQAQLLQTLYAFDKSVEAYNAAVDNYNQQLLAHQATNEIAVAGLTADIRTEQLTRLYESGPEAIYTAPEPLTHYELPVSISQHIESLRETDEYKALYEARENIAKVEKEFDPTLVHVDSPADTHSHDASHSAGHEHDAAEEEAENHHPVADDPFIGID